MRWFHFSASLPPLMDGPSWHMDSGNIIVCRPPIVFLFIWHWVANIKPPKNDWLKLIFVELHSPFPLWYHSISVRHYLLFYALSLMTNIRYHERMLTIDSWVMKQKAIRTSSKQRGMSLVRKHYTCIQYCQINININININIKYCPLLPDVHDKRWRA